MYKYVCHVTLYFKKRTPSDPSKNLSDGYVHRTQIASIRHQSKSEHAKSVTNLDLSGLPIEWALGVHWNVEIDAFTFRTIKRKNASTRGGILSDVSSMYDPLGFAAPFILPVKRLPMQV